MGEQLPAQARLTPQFCLSTTALRDFLRLSRSVLDDSITQNLNALLTPATQGFDTNSTSQRTLSPHTRGQVAPRLCQNFKDQVLFPTWQARSEALIYCALVATSPDPDDPEATVREAELEKSRAKVVDERLDPYSAHYFPREPRTTQLALLLRQEQGVENIVRSRTWGLIRERCGDSADNWERAMAEWRARNGA
ncbi:caffeine-induced death protein Cid2 [Diaporthe helianthi]|uniref:Caffeine-induced death protein Cid2 n=1 Tax=Diaporthe helianthi TaxID=158607 RepID=A0A2P5HKC4_DIAHE|nr:caffeine-induced death protein Cid2 [Diaporthe helianthi]